MSSIPAQKWTGSEIEPYVTVTLNGDKIPGPFSSGGKHYNNYGTSGYILLYENNIDEGTGKTIVQGIGKYSGRIEIPFQIGDTQITPPTPTIDVDISKASIYINGEHSSRNVKVDWTGKPVEPEITVWMADDSDFGSSQLTQGKDYAVSFANNTNIGTATVTVTGQGAYKSSKTVSFEIVGHSGSKFFPDDTYSFENPSLLLDKKYFSRFFPSSYAKELYEDQGGRSHGVCYGMAATAIASSALQSPPASSYSGKPTLFQVGRNDKSDVTSMTALEYIKYGYAIQFDPSISLEKQLSYSITSENLKAFYDKVVDSIRGNGEPLCLSIRGSDQNGSESGHAIWATGIGKETEAYTEIYVYDCNHPGETRVLRLNKDNNGQFSTWSYQLFDSPQLIWGTAQKDKNANLGWSTPGDFFTAAFSTTGKVKSDSYNKMLSIRSSFDYRKDNNTSIKFGGKTLNTYLQNDASALRATADSISLEGVNDDTSEVYWLSGNSSVKVADLPGNIVVGLADSESVIDARSDTQSTIEVNSSSSGNASVEFTQTRNARFSTSFQTVVDDENIDETYLTGRGSSEVGIIDGDDGIQVSGITELGFENSFGNRTYVKELNENDTYSIVPGDESTAPKVVGNNESSPRFTQKAVSVDAAGNHSVAILEDGSLWAWGCNDEGQIGDGTYEDRATPVKIMDGVVSVSLGNDNSAALKSDGSLWMWGRNKYGQVGDGTTTTRTSPVKIMEGVSSVSLGASTCAAVKTDGTLWVWGYNGQGGLGLGEPSSLYDYKATPTQLASNVSSVSLGNHAGGYVTTSGYLYTWGANAMYGNVGNGTNENVYTPIRIMTGVASVEMGELSSSAAIKKDGSPWTWGTNSYGMLGDGDSGSRNAPVKVADGIDAVSFGSDFSLVRFGESLKACGSNKYGQLGIGSTDASKTSLTEALPNVTMAAAGNSHALAIDADGKIYSWGRNNRGQLGTGDTNDMNTAKIIAEGSSSSAGVEAPLIDISNATVTNVPDAVYTGGSIKQSPIVTLDGKTLDEGWDYEVIYGDNISAGNSSVSIQGKGMYIGSVTKGFTISKISLENATFNPIADVSYTGKAQEPSVVAQVNGRTLVQGEDYKATYKNNVNPGTAMVTIEGIGNYSGTASATFKIVKTIQRDLSNATIAAIGGQTYTGKPITPSIRVSLDGNDLVSGTDFEAVYSSNTNAGTASVRITGKGDYTGAKSATFKINAANLSGATISGLADKTYTGKAQTQNPTVKLGATTLASDTDYTVSYKNNVNVGTATLTVTGKGNYMGTKSTTFKINSAPSSSKVNLSKATISGLKAKTYTGKALVQSPVVKVGSKTLKSGTDYTISYKNNKNVGTATVTVTGKGNYTGSKSATFKINKAKQPMTVKAKSPTVKASKAKKANQAIAAKKAFTVSKPQGKVTYKKTSGNKKITVASNGKVTVKKGLKKGTYKVKVKVTAKGNANYKSGNKSVTVTIIVK